MTPGCLKDCHIVVLGGTNFHKDYTTQNLKKWIERAGGHVAFKEILTAQTTHVVMDEDTWMNQGPFVRQILKEEVKETPEQKGRAIHIVSFDWLRECLEERVKRRESKFKWKNMAGGVLQSAQTGEEKQPGNTQGLMAQTFLNSTDTFLNAGEKKRIEKRKRQEANDRAEELEEEQREFGLHRKKMSIPEQAAVFRKGATKAQSEILSDNHHIYQDSTGFTFDVAITKVDFNNNANERYVLTLQIYESNLEPHSYAFNCSFAGTRVLPRNDIIAAIGSNFPTVFRVFKKVFKEHTKVEWDNRILEYNEREANARLNGGVEIPFKDMPFEYFPPKYGPLGELPLVQAEAMEALAQATIAERGFVPSPAVDDWKMSGGNGSRNDSPGFDNFMASSAKETGFPPDDQLNDSPFEYPFALNGGGKEDAIVLDDDEEDAVTETTGAEQEVMASNNDIVAEQDFIFNEGDMALQHEDFITQEGAQSYQLPKSTYDFDEALNLAQPLGSQEMPNGSPQMPSQPFDTIQTQAVDQTQLAESARAGLLSD